MQEREYQHKIINRINTLLPGAMVIKNDPTYVQGIPDLLVLYEDRWAMLEVKISIDSSIQPNQRYYIEMFNNMSFAAFIYPENEEDVLDALQSAFGIARQARLFEPEQL
jgi:hypothetical protein